MGAGLAVAVVEVVEGVMAAVEAAAGFGALLCCGRSNKNTFGCALRSAATDGPGETEAEVGREVAEGVAEVEEGVVVVGDDVVLERASLCRGEVVEVGVAVAVVEVCERKEGESLGDGWDEVVEAADAAPEEEEVSVKAERVVAEEGEEVAGGESGWSCGERDA